VCFSCRRSRVQKFTIIELLVAIVIISVATALAVGTLRPESPTQVIERSIAEFSNFCAGVRYRAAEEGRTWAVYFNSGNSTFTAMAVLTADEINAIEFGGVSKDFVTAYGQQGEEDKTSEYRRVQLRWKMPDKISYGREDASSDDEDDDNSFGSELEEELAEEERRIFEEDDMQKLETDDPLEQNIGRKVLYFYADGSAGGNGKIHFIYGSVEKTFEFSPLTGRFIESTEHEDDEYEI
jgi:Tfp pilus assembly protein FimT